jgi:hypothetical protein
VLSSQRGPLSRGALSLCTDSASDEDCEESWPDVDEDEELDSSLLDCSLLQSDFPETDPGDGSPEYSVSEDSACFRDGMFAFLAARSAFKAALAATERALSARICFSHMDA